ncbi:hypothetical protein ebA3419 [Aromatoleum aromaticum EbN1]|uniref:Uncharacterized protein n=1 Tax=Aromatoleum aromaticum (strain DSM 19018 / LMG 30748 / EbN1) TaxID=76114 RepID=Q5P3Q9_AROAE|nr:hypothetical protein ebA3419 [Aromatoleum aromaticum EbN1]
MISCLEDSLGHALHPTRAIFSLLREYEGARDVADRRPGEVQVAGIHLGRSEPEVEDVHSEARRRTPRKHRPEIDCKEWHPGDHRERIGVSSAAVRPAHRKRRIPARAGRARLRRLRGGPLPADRDGGQTGVAAEAFQIGQHQRIGHGRHDRRHGDSGKPDVCSHCHCYFPCIFSDEIYADSPAGFSKHFSRPCQLFFFLQNFTGQQPNAGGQSVNIVDKP